VANKTILTDCDGVLLDWEVKFRPWMERLGYKLNPTRLGVYSIGEQYGISHEKSTELIAKFNSGSDFESLPAWRDSVEYVQRLYTEGWNFVVITTAGTHPWTPGLRKNNLDKIFGEGIFNEIHVLPLHSDKGVVLKNYQDQGLFWIEDKTSNAELGLRYGLRPLLMTVTHNSSYAGPVQKVNNWAEIYKLAQSSL
jgi:hypothetical protein